MPFPPRRARPTSPPDAASPAGGAREAGVRLLARREWSTAALRDRLLEDGFEPGAVEAAVAALTASGALDDGRMAAAYARTASRVRRRGRLRILRELSALGVADDVARRAVDEALPAEEAAAQIERALDRALARAADERALRRAYASLVRLGYPPGEVAAALRRRRHGVPGTGPDD